MATTSCVLIVAVIILGGLLLTGWHIVAGILHLVFSVFRLLFHWPVILAIAVALIALWVFFLR